MAKILCIFGTRPEAIKLSSVIAACQGIGIEVANLNTGQQAELTNAQISNFDIDTLDSAAVLAPNQSLNSLLAKSLNLVGNKITKLNPDAVIVQGDTTTALAGAIAASYEEVPVIHVEAGLRTLDRTAPFPEEINRTLIAQIASLHCAPTQGNVDNLIRENISVDNIVLTGNPIVDVIEKTVSKHQGSPNINEIIEWAQDRQLCVLTTHRRENFGKRLENYLAAVTEIAQQRSDVAIVVVRHPNHRVKETFSRCLQERSNLRIIEPLPYPEFISLLKNAHLIISDSGGIQEEAVSLRVPLLVLRKSTERPEAIESGIAKLATTPSDLLSLMAGFFAGTLSFELPKRNPFGDGNSGTRIAAEIRRHLNR